MVPSEIQNCVGSHSAGTYMYAYILAMWQTLNLRSETYSRKGP